MPDTPAVKKVGARSPATKRPKKTVRFPQRAK